MDDKYVTVRNEYSSGFLEATVLSVECRTLSYWEGQTIPEFTAYYWQYVLSKSGITQSPFTEAHVLPPLSSVQDYTIVSVPSFCFVL